MNEPILISRREAAKALSISIRKLDYLIAAKEIQCCRIGGRNLIPVGALREFARRDHVNKSRKTETADANVIGTRGESNEQQL